MTACLCGRAHPCSLHGMDAIRARESGADQPVQASLFDTPTPRAIVDTPPLS